MVIGRTGDEGVDKMKIMLKCNRNECKETKIIEYEDWIKSCLPLNMERVRCKNRHVMVFVKDVE